ncbi:MAG TPA: choice-of-anchor P family protein [Steroidobacteraceae bacterium]|nr:choice-of-anchor P family protein [Steroidobacteraceae bacterium]
MQSFRQNPFYSFRVDASALGGFLEEPFPKVIPTVAPVSLPPVGGFATARSQAFDLDEIVSCSSAYSRVSGTEHHTDGSISILTTAVVEDLNLLEVVTAERVVAQVSISIPAGTSDFQISLTGSRIEGLRLAGRPCQPTLNAKLIPPGGSHLLWQDVQKAGQSQAEDLIAIFKARGKDADQWAQKRHGWMTANPPLPAGGGKLLCSLVDGVDGNDGHIVEIPGFGRIFLGELRVSYDSVQLVAIRAELGCPVKGKVSVSAVGGGGHGDN